MSHGVLALLLSTGAIAVWCRLSATGTYLLARSPYPSLAAVAATVTMQLSF
ncbi:hypothetical protein [cf. Phormidesmis sp. LEGE 11477]|uniref:hypothetical protein n=1 Tax=cf. Phormidesmis sp. LEGE 11477 TaxID=1828680 RepID=UPI001882738A|nr:hypothetical protein [cf. Phormidesmis sp. LEGE 11477]MBE9063420.1 hypothetical protein [cf. Phormidesmis sp. LEGE 11477]